MSPPFLQRQRLVWMTIEEDKQASQNGWQQSLLEVKIKRIEQYAVS